MHTAGTSTQEAVQAFIREQNIRLLKRALKTESQSRRSADPQEASEGAGKNACR
jgi:hypothetical protein